jgi:hydroxymethylglutaryl-CoA lyase
VIPGLPQKLTQHGLPQRVTVYEVGARDGLQYEPTVVQTSAKAEFIERLAAAGLWMIEATGFVHPKWVPQLADADELMPMLAARKFNEHTRLPVLVPNRRGLARAAAAGSRDVVVLASATESFARKSLNSTIEDSLAEVEATLQQALARGMRARGHVAMCFGDPWEGPVSMRKATDVVARLIEAGCTQVSLGDTLGSATPGHVRTLIDALERRGVPRDRLAVHFHDGYGQALANTYAALQAGIATIESAAGGLGGRPYTESGTGTTGNAGILGTEDLVWMLDGLGITTGVDLGKLVDASSWMGRLLGRPVPSRAVQALTRGRERTPAPDTTTPVNG